jgi:hypothetical protein
VRVTDNGFTSKHRDLSARTGLHTYVGVCVKKSKPELYHYFSPEVFAPERPEVSVILKVTIVIVDLFVRCGHSFCTNVASDNCTSSLCVYV